MKRTIKTKTITLVSLGLILILLSLSFLAACSSPAPAPGAAPAPAAAPATPVAARTIEFNIASPYAPASKTSIAAAEWVQQVTKRTGGTVKPTYYPGGALGTGPDILNLIRTGTVGAGVFGQGFVKDFPVFDFLELPFMISGPLAGQTMAYELFYKGYLDKGLGGLKVMTFEPTSHFRIFTKKKPITSLDDLKGLKIRGAGPQMANTLTTMGTTPVTIPPGELYTSLEKGIVDGIMCGADLVSANKLYEVSKYALWEPLGTGIIFFLMNDKVWNSISPENQAIIQQVNREVAFFNLDLSLNEHMTVAATMKKNGMELNKLSAAERARFEKLIKETRMVTFKEGWNTAGIATNEVLDILFKMTERFKYVEVFD